MKKLLVGLLLVLSCYPANAQKSKSQLQTEINTAWPDNNTGQITPKVLRGPPQDIVNSYLDLNGATSFACPAGQVLSGFTSLSLPTCTVPPAGSGTVTQVNTGTGLTGGPITGTGTISLGLPTLSTIGGVKAFTAPANQFMTGISGSGDLTSARPTCANLSNASASCSTDATNASNLSSGTLPSGRFPALVGDLTTVAGNLTTTLATVNSNTGSFGSPTNCVNFNVNAKGLIIAATAVTCTPAITSVTGLGTNVATALNIPVGTAGSFIVQNGVGGTPSSMVGTNITALNASQLTTGTVAAARGGAGTITGALAANGSGVVSQAASTQLSDATAAGAWATTDQSGAGLSFTSVTGNFSVINKTCVGNLRATFPSTANGSNARLSVPCSAANNGNQAIGSCFTTAAAPNGTLIPLILANTAAITFINTAGSAVSSTNANLSTATITCSFAYITP